MGKKFLLAIDAGHGKYVGGNRCMKSLDPNQTAEWVLGDRVSRAIAERAKQYEDFETMRVDDVTGNEDVGMSKRVAKANAADADFYISNHFNAGIYGDKGGGVEAYCVALGGQAEQYRDALYNAVVEAGGLRGNRETPLRTANFYVLRNTDAPAVLVEYGYMDSPSDVPVILNHKYTTAVGYAVADRIAQMNGLRRLGTFTDVMPSAYYYKAVEWAVKKRITNGTSKVAFSPDEPCTRAQAVTMLYRMYGGGADAKPHGFDDVDAADYYDKAVRWAKEKGITNGVDADSFAPDDVCTRGQVVTMLYRAAGSPAVTSEIPFEDVKADAYYAQAVRWAVSKGITKGMDATHFAPDKPCTRADMVTFLYRV